jgi:hypothetical protein
VYRLENAANGLLVHGDLFPSQEAASRPFANRNMGYY